MLCLRSPPPHFRNFELCVTSASTSSARLSNCHGHGDVPHSIPTGQEATAISLSCTVNSSAGNERSAQSVVIDAQSVGKEDFHFSTFMLLTMAMNLLQARNSSVLWYHTPTFQLVKPPERRLWIAFVRASAQVSGVDQLISHRECRY